MQTFQQYEIRTIKKSKEEKKITFAKQQNKKMFLKINIGE